MGIGCPQGEEKGCDHPELQGGLKCTREETLHTLCLLTCSAATSSLTRELRRAAIARASSASFSRRLASAPALLWPWLATSPRSGRGGWGVEEWACKSDAGDINGVIRGTANVFRRSWRPLYGHGARKNLKLPPLTPPLWASPLAEACCATASCTSSRVARSWARAHCNSR